MYGLVKTHILKALIREAKALQEAISTFTARKGVCECLIKILSLQATDAFSP